MTPPVRVLTVCTGNVCRSPAAGLLLTHRLGDDPEVLVTSACTAAPEGSPVSGPIAALLRADGIDPSGHRARWLTAAEVRSADLVLAMTKDHRSRAVSLFPAAVRRSFTLREFARIVDAIPATGIGGDTAAQRLRSLIAAAPFYRRGGEDDDIDDPYGLSAAVNAAIYAEIVESVDVITRAILDPGPAAH